MLGNTHKSCNFSIVKISEADHHQSAVINPLGLAPKNFKKLNIPVDDSGGFAPRIVSNNVELFFDLRQASVLKLGDHEINLEMPANAKTEDEVSCVVQVKQTYKRDGYGAFLKNILYFNVFTRTLNKTHVLRYITTPKPPEVITFFESPNAHLSNIVWSGTDFTHIGKLAIALSETTSADMLDLLSKDDDDHVKKVAISCLNSRLNGMHDDVDVLSQSLSQPILDPDLFSTTEHAKLIAEAINPDTTADRLYDLAQYGATEVQSAIARNPVVQAAVVQYKYLLINSKELGRKLGIFVELQPKPSEGPLRKKYKLS